MMRRLFTKAAATDRRDARTPRVRLMFVALALPLMLGACQSLGDLVGDPSLKPSSSPVIADNVRSGRLAKVGAAQHPKILATYGGEYSNPKLERMVAGIVGKLVTVSDNPTQVYQITILNSPNVNAFALPGGYLYVTRGLLALANDTAELAAVIAHEMAHVTANHGVLRQQKEAEVELASRVVTDVLADKDAGKAGAGARQAPAGAFLAQPGTAGRRDRHRGNRRSGLRPLCGGRFPEVHGGLRGIPHRSGEDDTSLDFLATHPSTPQRIELAIGHARKFGSPGKGERDHEGYLAGLDGLLFGDTAEEGYVRGQTYRISASASLSPSPKASRSTIARRRCLARAHRTMRRSGSTASTYRQASRWKPISLPAGWRASTQPRSAR